MTRVITGQPIGRAQKPAARLREIAARHDQMADCCNVFAAIVESGDIEGAKLLLAACQEEIEERKSKEPTP